MDNAIFSSALVGVGGLLGISVLVFISYFPGRVFICKKYFCYYYQLNVQHTTGAPTEEAISDAKVLLELKVMIFGFNEHCTHLYSDFF